MGKQLEDSYIGKPLEDSYVFRGGQHIDFDKMTLHEYKEEDTKVHVTNNGNLLVVTSIRSKGGGRTTVCIEFGQLDYPTILDNMFRNMRHKHSLDLLISAIESRESNLIRTVRCSVAMRIFNSTRNSISKMATAFYKKRTPLNEKKLKDAKVVHEAVTRLVLDEKKKDFKIL